MSRADRAIRAAAGSAVGLLAGIAGAVSYAHMRVLADDHGETGWRGHAFPLSVDGIEVVASLVLLADRRVGHRSGWLVWAALAAGTAASMAANVAVGASDPVGRVVAGWPAFALLLSIKLLSGLIERPGTDSATAPNQSAVIADRVVEAGETRARTAGENGPRRHGQTTTASGARVPADMRDLIRLGHAVRAQATAAGGKLTRTVLAARLRDQGVSLSNARLSVLLRELKASPAGGPDHELGGAQ